MRLRSGGCFELVADKAAFHVLEITRLIAQPPGGTHDLPATTCIYRPNHAKPHQNSRISSWTETNQSTHLNALHDHIRSVGHPLCGSARPLMLTNYPQDRKSAALLLSLQLIPAHLIKRLAMTLSDSLAYTWSWIWRARCLECEARQRQGLQFFGGQLPANQLTTGPPHRYGWCARYEPH